MLGDSTVSRLPRLQGFDYRGQHCYFLTFCTYKRRDTLLNQSIAVMVERQILRAALRFEFAVLAYCLMPDHVHLLMGGRSQRSDLRRFIKRAKQSSGQRYAATAGKSLWQDSYHDHVVRPEEDLAGIARYIIENPVRAGLVESPLDYRFVGSTVWPLEELIRR